jgi:hypothetical protein
LRCEGFDPGVELLLRHFLSQLIEANFPQSLSCFIGIGGVLSVAHWQVPWVWTVAGFIRLKSNFIKSLSTCEVDRLRPS